MQDCQWPAECIVRCLGYQDIHGFAPPCRKQSRGAQQQPRDYIRHTRTERFSFQQPNTFECVYVEKAYLDAESIQRCTKDAIIIKSIYQSRIHTRFIS